MVAEHYVPYVVLKVTPSVQIGLPSDRQAIKEYILARVAKEGFDPQVVDRIIMCESGYNPTAKHLNKNGTWDIGVFQINDVHRLSVEDRIDVVRSTEYAIGLMKSKTGLRHWMCYR